LAVLTAFMGPEERRAADITLLAGPHDPREALFGVLSVARDLTNLAATMMGTEHVEVLQLLAEQDATENG
jgi:hypothetical protein